MLALKDRLLKINTPADLDKQIRLASKYAKRLRTAVDKDNDAQKVRADILNEYDKAVRIETTLKKHFFEAYEALVSKKPLLPIFGFEHALPFKKGDSVLVEWDGFDKPLLGTFIEYTEWMKRDDLPHAMVEMENGFPCNYPGFYSGCLEHADKRAEA